MLFKAKVLSQYDVAFYRCKDTCFIQTEEPYWLQESYSSAITKLDVGLVLRNENLAKVAVPLLLRYFNHNGLFLDYAGGYGIFTRMMRDRGFQFYHTDPYCQNIFAEFHDLKDLPKNVRFEVVTAFEVLEHLASPMEEIKKILAYGNNLFFTTELVPSDVTKDWWYFSLETGQRISFYTKEALQYIANHFQKYYYTDGKWLHLFMEAEVSENPFEAIYAKEREPFLIRKLRKFLAHYDKKKEAKNPVPKKESLLDKDVREARNRILPH